MVRFPVTAQSLLVFPRIRRTSGGSSWRNGEEMLERQKKLRFNLFNCKKCVCCCLIVCLWCVFCFLVCNWCFQNLRSWPKRSCHRRALRGPSSNSKTLPGCRSFSFSLSDSNFAVRLDLGVEKHYPNSNWRPEENSKMLIERRNIIVTWCNTYLIISIIVVIIVIVIIIIIMVQRNCCSFCAKEGQNGSLHMFRPQIFWLPDSAGCLIAHLPRFILWFWTSFLPLSKIVQWPLLAFIVAFPSRILGQNHHESRGPRHSSSKQK